MDGNAEYNQIFMATEDISKTAFLVDWHDIWVEKRQCNLLKSHEL
jgi:hypothetical protein